MLTAKDAQHLRGVTEDLLRLVDGTYDDEILERVGHNRVESVIIDLMVLEKTVAALLARTLEEAVEDILEEAL